MPDEEKTCGLDYKTYYDKHRAEIEHLKMKLRESESRCQMLKEEVTKLSAIKATVEVIFGGKIDA